MKKVLLICDKPFWAYDAIAKCLVKYNDDPDLELSIEYIKGGDLSKFKDPSYDLLFFLGWQLLGEVKTLRVRELWPDIPHDKIITGIHSHHSWDNRKTQPEQDVLPPKKLVRFLKKYKGVNAVSNKLTNVFKKAGLDEVMYTPNGVDTEVFKPEGALNMEDELRVGYSGTFAHDWRKGITQFIEPACEAAGVTLLKAMPVDGHHIPLDEMPGFYNKIDVYLCASSSEGFSLSVLEASSCGRAIVSTRVGGSEDLITSGENGFLVNRDVKEMTDALVKLKEDRNLMATMGNNNRKLIESEYTWKIKVGPWFDFIKQHLNS